MNLKILSILLLFLQSNLLTSQTIKKLDGTILPAPMLTKKIDELMKASNVQGMAISVFNKNRSVYKKVFGYKRIDIKDTMLTNTNMYGASLSKAVFAVLVMKLIEVGKITLDKPLHTYLPKPIYEYGKGTSWNQDYTELKNDTLYKKITARMCLTHTSGFPNWRWQNPDEKIAVIYTPGERFNYSGEGLTYLQFILEKITARTLEQLMDEKIFKPLRMTKSAYTWRPDFESNYATGHASDNKLYEKDKDNAARSASTLETTLDDYTLFLDAMLQKKILKRSSYKEMFKTQYRIRTKAQFGPLSRNTVTTDFDPIQLGYGLGWGVIHTPNGIGAFKEGHGDGFQHYSILFPAKGIGILMMTNSDNGEKYLKSC